MVDAPPISIKGVLIEDSEVVLLENERGEWELPGGRPERGEQPTACLMRELSRLVLPASIREKIRVLFHRITRIAA